MSVFGPRQGAFFVVLFVQLCTHVLAQGVPANITLPMNNGTLPKSNVSVEPLLPTFGDTVQILGQMQRTDQDFQDGLALDLFSPKARTLVVTQNKAHLAPQYVSGTTGEGFIALQNYSYIIKTNDSAIDLIAKIEVPFSPADLASRGIQSSNTFVAKLASDNKSWVINEATRNVHNSENNSRIIKMTSLDGEFLLVGRTTVDSANIFVQYGQGETRTVNLTGGIGMQSAEFVDGLRITTISETPLRVNVELRNGVNPGTLPDGMMSLNPYAWIVNTSNPRANITADMRVPFNRALLTSQNPTGSSPTSQLVVAKRALNATSGQFQPVLPAQQKVLELSEDRILVPGMTQLDGQYLILIRPLGA